MFNKVEVSFQCPLYLLVNQMKTLKCLTSYCFISSSSKVNSQDFLYVEYLFVKHLLIGSTEHFFKLERSHGSSVNK